MAPAATTIAPKGAPPSLVTYLDGSFGKHPLIGLQQRVPTSRAIGPGISFGRYSRQSSMVGRHPLPGPVHQIHLRARLRRRPGASRERKRKQQQTRACQAYSHSDPLCCHFDHRLDLLIGPLLSPRSQYAGLESPPAIPAER